MAQEAERDRRFGVHGGQYIPETLMNAVIELEEVYKRHKDDPKFSAELMELPNEYAGRPSRLYYAEHMTEGLGGAKIYLKREDLSHTGIYKINNALNQILFTKYMGEKRLTAETGVGRHGAATTTVATLLNMGCVVYMGEEDTVRQALNVYRICLLGVEAVAVETGTRTLKDAVSEATCEWTARIEDTRYYIGSYIGPHPFPIMMCDFQTIISKEIKEEMQRKEGRLPDTVIACVGGGSDAIDSFYHFIGDKSVCLTGCEVASRDVHTMKTAATASVSSLGIFHGIKSYFCQNKYGRITSVYPISAGLDYPGVRPEHAYLHDLHCAGCAPVMDGEVIDIFEYLARTKSIIPVIESTRTAAYARKLAPTVDRDKVIVITLSGRGNKNAATIARYRGENLHE